MGQFHRFLAQRPRDIVEVRKRLKWLYAGSIAYGFALLLGVVLSTVLGTGVGGVVGAMVPLVFVQAELYDLRRTYWTLRDAGADA